jgi:hypothetical protein
MAHLRRLASIVAKPKGAYKARVQTQAETRTYYRRIESIGAAAHLLYDLQDAAVSRSTWAGFRTKKGDRLTSKPLVASNRSRFKANLSYTDVDTKAKSGDTEPASYLFMHEKALSSVRLTSRGQLQSNSQLTQLIRGRFVD